MADITKINLNGTNYNLVDSAATSAIASEVSRAQGAESAITSALSAEVVARQSADTQIQTALSGKADASTTLSGYGITDAYTKTEVDNALSGKADTATTLSGYGITDAYTKTETDNAITAATSGLQATLSAGTGIEITTGNVINCTIDTTLYVVVSTLPAEPAAGNENKIHLVPLASGSTGQNDSYEEYLWKGDAWEYLGVRQAEVDLSGYWTSAQTQSAITAATSGKVDTSALTNYYTSAETLSAITDEVVVDVGEYITQYGSVEDVLDQAGVAYYDSAQQLYIVNSLVNTDDIPDYVAENASASYDSQTETLILNLPTTPSE